MVHNLVVDSDDDDAAGEGYQKPYVEEGVGRILNAVNCPASTKRECSDRSKNNAIDLRKSLTEFQSSRVLDNVHLLSVRKHGARPVHLYGRC